jgi:cytoskeletal protein CcmA (bactofilin family)
MTTPTTTIAPHTTIQGDLHCAGPAIIAGRLDGNISSTDSLELAPESQVTGDILAATLTIRGTLKGNITATHTRLGTSARVVGKLCTASLAIAEGARFIGQVCIGEVAAPTSPNSPKIQDSEEIIALRGAEVTIAPADIPTNENSTAPTVQIIPETVQAALNRGPRIIRAH